MLASIIDFILMPIVWIPIVGVLAFLTYRNYRKINKLTVLNVDSVLLMLEIPRTNDKKELAAEQLFASLHGILRDANELRNSGGVQEHLSFEIVSTAGQIRFYVWVPKILQSFVEGQIYAQYPTVQIYKMDDDYVDNRLKHPLCYSTELTLTDDQALPIKTFENFEVDPLAGITGTLAKLDPDHSEELWIQILVRPVSDDWHKTTDAWISRTKLGRRSGANFLGIDFTWLSGLWNALSVPPEGGLGGAPTAVELSDRDKTRIAKAEEKATKLGYEAKIRLAYLGSDEISAKLNIQALVGTFKQYNSTNLNGFKMLDSGSFEPAALDAYKMRAFADHGFILNISELASVYHLPHTSVETPNIVWASSKTAEPPAKLPLLTGNPADDEDISAFGLTNFRGINHQFGLLRRDRSRHVYIIGQTGAGKSGLLELFALSDIFYNQGYCIIDPHGDFAINNLKFIPKNRIGDVIYFNPADTSYPVAFNPLELSDPSRKPNVCSEVIGVLKRMFGESWGPRLEHILRYTLLALLDRPSTTLLDISRMLTDKDFRKETLDYCTDVTVLQFWKHEFGQWNEKQINESIAPVLNKVGAFTANPIIRNIVGQPHSSFDIRQIMDEGKILIVNLSKGLIGEDNASILGAFLVTKVQLAAMSRSDIPDIKDRRPFYLYVDEFQNFATDSFTVILSEARKYGLNLTVANQYIAQMTDSVRDAVFGNVGTTISFRVSADDAPLLAKQFEPAFDASDLLQMNNRHFVISMIIGGEKVPAFSATTLQIPEPTDSHLSEIIDSSRELYSRPRSVVEAEIRDTIEQSEKYKRELSDSGRPSTGNYTTPSSAEKVKFEYHPHPATPQADFRKQKLSPNTAEHKDRPGLKDLSRLLAEADSSSEQGITAHPSAEPSSEKPRSSSSKKQSFLERDDAGFSVLQSKTDNSRDNTEQKPNRRQKSAARARKLKKALDHQSSINATKSASKPAQKPTKPANNTDKSAKPVQTTNNATKPPEPTPSSDDAAKPSRRTPSPDKFENTDSLDSTDDYRLMIHH